MATKSKESNQVDVKKLLAANSVAAELEGLGYSSIKTDEEAVNLPVENSVKDFLDQFESDLSAVLLDAKDPNALWNLQKSMVKTTLDAFEKLFVIAGKYLKVNQADTYKVVEQIYLLSGSSNRDPKKAEAKAREWHLGLARNNDLAEVAQELAMIALLSRDQRMTEDDGERDKYRKKMYPKTQVFKNCVINYSQEALCKPEEIVKWIDDVGMEGARLHDWRTDAEKDAAQAKITAKQNAKKLAIDTYIGSEHNLSVNHYGSVEVPVDRVPSHVRMNKRALAFVNLVPMSNTHHKLNVQHVFYPKGNSKNFSYDASSLITSAESLFFKHLEKAKNSKDETKEMENSAYATSLVNDVKKGEKIKF